MASKVLGSDYQYLVDQLKSENGVEILLDNLRNSLNLKIALNLQEYVNIMLRTAMTGNIELFDRVVASVDEETIPGKTQMVMTNLLQDPVVPEILKIHIRLNYPHVPEVDGCTGPCPVQYSFKIAHREIHQEIDPEPVPPADELNELDLNDK